ncbi:MAG TPA: molybdopterin-dependent oxidoreductase [Anaeromyxobacteraceae bacterium]|nr:molybdopterin-dependent oxidoreductase [Anaeromyxobacteraceae bacterium]
METVRATCPFDCPDACGLLVDVEGGRALKVRGDPEHPYSQGSLCPKVNGYERSVHHPGRLLTPMLRDGRKGEGRFRPVSWDEAIRRVAAGLREVADRHGPEAILPYSYAGTMGLVQRNASHAFFHALGASRLDRTICSPAKGAGWKAVMGDTLAPHPDEVLSSDLAIVWSLNAVATSIHFVQRLKEARRRGAEVWVVETYRTPTSELADRVILIRPGSDGALALGMAHVLFRDGLADVPFLEANAQGWRRWRDEVLPECTPTWTAGKTGLDAATVEDLARRYAAARAPFIRLGSGLSRYGNGAMTVRSIACLPAVVGAWAKPGGGLLGSTSGSQAFDTGIVTREDLQPRPTRLVNMNQLGHALNVLDSPRVMALFVHTANPAAVTPDQEQVLRGLAREDLFTVVHERYLTDTARWADVLLPATTALEHDDLYCSYGQYVIQRVRPSIPPVGESLCNWDLFRRLAAAMGIDHPFFRQTSADLVDALLAKPAPLRRGIDDAALAAGKGIELALPPGYKLALRTPSGKIEIENPRQRHPLPRWLPSHEEDGPLPFRLVTGASVFGLNSSFREREELRAREGEPALMVNPADAAARGLSGPRVVAWNGLGEATFALQVTERTPPGVVVAEGVPWLSHVKGGRTVNALTSQRLTDEGAGSTFYDNRVDLRPGG